MDPGNADYAAYMAWTSAGNTAPTWASYVAANPMSGTLLGGGK